MRSAGTSRFRIAAALAVAAASGIVGFVYGDAVVLAFAQFWSTFVLPAFMTMYLTGLAFCT